MEKTKKDMDRRKFLKLLGAGAAVTSAAFYGCRPERKTASGSLSGEIPTDKMTYMGHRTKRILRIERKEYQTY